MIVSVVFCLYVLYVLPSIAQTRTVFTIGGNYWYAQRKLSGDYYLNGEIESKSGNMVGPYLNLRIGNLILGASAFWGTFSESNINHLQQSIDYYKIPAKRTDINGSLGYSLINNPGFSLTVFGAVKTMNMNRDYTTTYTDAQSVKWDTDGKYDETGTLLGGGVSCVIRFPESPIFIFGSASYLQGNRNFKYTISYNGEELEGWGFDDTGTAQLSALSGGIGFQTGSNISILVGYRADIFDFKLDRKNVSNYTGRENLGGLSVTMAYTFR